MHDRDFGTHPIQQNKLIHNSKIKRSKIPARPSTRNGVNSSYKTITQKPLFNKNIFQLTNNLIVL